MATPSPRSSVPQRLSVLSSLYCLTEIADAIHRDFTSGEYIDPRTARQLRSQAQSIVATIEEHLPSLDDQRPLLDPYTVEHDPFDEMS